MKVKLIKGKVVGEQRQGLASSKLIDGWLVKVNGETRGILT